jgi:type I restriction enzyme S subunit
VPQDIFLSLSVPLPRLSEQRRIVTILDRAATLVRKRMRAIDLLQEMLLSLIANCVNDVRTTSWIELGDVIREGPTNGLYKPASEYGEGVPILRIDSFYDGKITSLESLKRLRVNESEMERYQLQVGDMVISRVNSLEHVGKSAVVDKLSEPTVFESNIMKFAVDSSILLPEVCIALLQTSAIKQQVLRKAKKAINQSSINQRDVKSLQLPLPCMAAQRKFLSAANKIELMKAKVAKDEAALSSLLLSLQSRAFSGQL